MAYKSLEECLLDLKKHGQLIEVNEKVDPELELAAIQLRLYEKGAPAVLFNNVAGTKYRVAANIFGTLDRCKFIFRDSLDAVKQAIELKNNPLSSLKNPFQLLGNSSAFLNALPLKNPTNKPVLFEEIKIEDLPMIKHWPKDGGAFVTLPQVYSEDISKPGIANSNLGMYRIQLNGNEYRLNEQIGLHYQIHRGIGVHQSIAKAKDQHLKVSIFIGGPPAHTLAAVMPLPEGMSEINFAGLLAGRRFRYIYKDGFAISTDADFVITGEVDHDFNLPEGPFGDHLGYYSLQHQFPAMRVYKVYAKKNAIWPFTVVGRPPQEDTSFGDLIHEITGTAINYEIPGLVEVNAVDAAGVHPLLLAIGKERYTPYFENKFPQELLTLSNRILGTGQLSLAKYLWITDEDSNPPKTADSKAFMLHILERIDWNRDVHFQTNTTIDTLDYSGTGLNSGSKVVFAAIGNPIRKLCEEIPNQFIEKGIFKKIKLVAPGIIAVAANEFDGYENTKSLVGSLDIFDNSVALIILVDDPEFVAASWNNFLWVCFTRSNPAKDIYGIGSFVEHKHWGCKGTLIIDARIKPHHAPVLEQDESMLKKIEPLFQKGGSLFGY